MLPYRYSVNRTILLAVALLCAACASNPTESSKTTVTPQATVTPRISGPTHTPSPKPAATSAPTLPRYTAHLRLKGVGSPDDMTFDNQGQLLFSDVTHGTVNRLNHDNTVTILESGLSEPEGIVILANNHMVLSEQGTNRILAFSPGSQTPSVLRVLPGSAGGSGCRAGIDSIALDPTTQTIIVPDSPTGDVYRMSLDGHQLTLLISGLSRPVGATVDPQGNIYIADECGATLWKITPGGVKTRLTGFGMPDDVALDPQGNLLVVDLKATAHSLIRVDSTSGKHEILADNMFIEPQGLLVDKNGHIFVSDDSANLIMEFIPV